MRHSRIHQSLFFGLLLFFAMGYAGQTGSSIQKEIITKAETNQIIELPDFGFLWKNLAVLLPKPALDLFSNFKIENAAVQIGIPGYPGGFAVSGTVKYKGFAVFGKVLVTWQKEGKEEMSILFELPNTWKFSDSFSALKIFDPISLKKAFMILSSFEYDEEQIQELGASTKIKEGLNFLAAIDLSGPFKELKKLIDIMVKYKDKLGEAVILEGLDNLILTGVLPSDLSKTELTMNIPLRFGVDFVELAKRGAFKEAPSVIRKIATDRFTVAIGAEGKITTGMGILVGFASQPEDIVFYGKVLLAFTNASIAGAMEGIYRKAFGLDWLDLGNFGIQIDIDYALLPELIALGIPFTGIGLRGFLGLGEGQYRTDVEFAGYISLKEKKIGDFVLRAGPVSKLTLAQFIVVFNKITGVNIDPNTIPPIEFNNMLLALAPKDTDIAGKIYQAGIEATGEFVLGPIAGGGEFLFDTDKFSFAGVAYLKNIITPVFKITGVGKDLIENTGDDGPVLRFGFSPTFTIATSENIENGQNLMGVFIDGMVEIPPLGIQQGTRMLVSPEVIHFGIDGKIFNKVAAHFKIDFRLKEPGKFLGEFEFKQSFLDELKKNIGNYFEQLKKDSQSEIAKFNDDLKKYQDQLNTGASAKLYQLDKQIERLSKLRDNYYDKCDTIITTPIECGKLNLLREQILELKGEKALIRAGTTVVLSATDLLNLITSDEKLLEAEQKTLDILNQALSGLVIGAEFIVVKRIYGVVKGEDLAVGKMPLVALEFANGKKLENMQFDFKNPEQSAHYIAKQILNFFK